jgi:flagellin-like protein
MHHRRWRLRGSHRGISPIIGTIFLLAMTIIAGALLWSFRFYTPPPTPTVTFMLTTGGSNPVWGDPTDNPPGGGYSEMNTSAIIVASFSPSTIPLSEIQFTFVCNNESHGGNETILVQGSLASMTWFPGDTSNPSPNAPKLGWCSSFHAGGFGGGSFGTLYNRLGLFDPISDQTTTLEAGDTFLLYIHNGGFPLDYSDCGRGHSGCFDQDDYHGAPPWCFTTAGECTIYLTYTGTPGTLLATIPVESLAPPQS